MSHNPQVLGATYFLPKLVDYGTKVVGPSSSHPVEGGTLHASGQNMFAIFFSSKKVVRKVSSFENALINNPKEQFVQKNVVSDLPRLRGGGNLTTIPLSEIRSSLLIKS